MATLAQIFGAVKSVCLKDEEGVYLNNERVALSNSEANGYIRRNGARSLTLKGAPCVGDYDSEIPLIFVGAVPGADAEKLERATIAALVAGDNIVVSSEIQKDVIAESESIDRQDLQKFDGVAMIWVSYNASTAENYDPNCDYGIC